MLVWDNSNTMFCPETYAKQCMEQFLFFCFLPFWFLGFQNIVFPLALLVSQGGDHETSGSVGRGTTIAMNEPLGSWNDWHYWHNHLASQMLVVSENVPSGNLPLVYICPLVIH